MPKVGFFTPVNSTGSKGFFQKGAELADQVFYFGGKKAVILQGKAVKDGQAVEIQAPVTKYPKWKFFVKAGQCATGIIPLIALVYKGIYRATHHFEIIPTSGPKKSSQKPSQKNPSEKTDPKPNSPLPQKNPSEKTDPQPTPPPSNNNVPKDRLKMGQERMQQILDQGEDTPITSGQGEYLVYHVEGDQLKEVSFETYKKVYEVFKRHIPHFSKNSLLENGPERYANIRKEVKEIDPSLEISFLARTLVELAYLSLGVTEDLKDKQINPRIRLQYAKVQLKIDPDNQLINRIIANERKLCENKTGICWYKTFFTDDAHTPKKKLKRVAFKFNNEMVKKLPSADPLTIAQMKDIAQDSIKLLQSIAPDAPDSPIKKLAQGMSKKHLQFGAHGGPTAAFSLEKKDLEPNNQPRLFGLGLRKEGVEKKMIEWAMIIECLAAENCFVVFRGGKINEDQPVLKNSEQYSTSYGSLFGCSVYDQGATALHFMRQENRDAFAIQVPFKDLENGIFNVTRHPAIREVTSAGEYVHSRSRVPGGLKDDDKVHGIAGCSYSLYKDLPDSLKTNLSQEELQKEFDRHYDNAIVLKGQQII